MIANQIKQQALARRANVVSSSVGLFLSKWRFQMALFVCFWYLFATKKSTHNQLKLREFDVHFCSIDKFYFQRWRCWLCETLERKFKLYKKMRSNLFPSSSREFEPPGSQPGKSIFPRRCGCQVSQPRPTRRWWAQTAVPTIHFKQTYRCGVYALLVHAKLERKMKLALSASLGRI